MKVSFGKRLVLFVHWLLSVVACVAVLFFCLAPDTIRKGIEAVNGSLGVHLSEIASFVLLMLYGMFRF